jgi:hypothetical protein
LKRAAARIGAGDEDGSKILVRVGLAVTCSVAAFTVSYLTNRGWNINKPEDGSDPPPDPPPSGTELLQTSACHLGLKLIAQFQVLQQSLLPAVNINPCSAHDVSSECQVVLLLMATSKLRLASS